MNPEEYDMYRAQEALQQQQIDANSMYNAPMLQEQMHQSQSALVKQTDPKKIVKEIMLRLQGKEEKQDGTCIQIAEPKLNKDGIDNIWFILDSHINQNVILSHLNDKEIPKIMESLQSDVVDDLTLNWKSYGIKKKTDLDTINNSILINIFLALKRAEGQNEKNWLGKVSIENISNVGRMNPPKKGGFWSNFRLG